MAELDIYTTILDAMTRRRNLEIVYNGTVRVVTPTQLTARTSFLANQISPQPGIRNFFIYRIEAIKIIEPYQTGAYNVQVSPAESPEHT